MANYTRRELKQAIDYTVDLMDVMDKSMTEVGDVVYILLSADTTSKVAVEQQSSELFNTMLDIGFTLIGRGTAVEKVSTDWFVAWRPYNPSPALEEMTE